MLLIQIFRLQAFSMQYPLLPLSKILLKDQTIQLFNSKRDKEKSDNYKIMIGV